MRRYDWRAAGIDPQDTVPPRGSEQSREELIERLLDAQQDINLAANTYMSQPLADASALIDEIEPILRALLSTAHAEGLGKEDEYGVQTHVEPQHCTGWRTIDSAPLDGTRVIVGWDDSTSLPMHREMGRYRSGTGKGSGWCNTYGHSFGGDPTHWMPLPAPPSSELTDQQRGAPLEQGS